MQMQPTPDHRQQCGAQQQLLRQSIDEMRTAFRLFDMLSAGAVRTQELPLLLYAVGVDAGIDDVQSAMHGLFGEQLSRVDFSEFRSIVASLSVAPDTDEEAALVYERVAREASVVTEDEGDSSLCLLPSALAHFVRRGAPFTAGTRGPTFAVERLFQQLDRDGDGVISMREWMNFVSPDRDRQL
jgi:Ca2+-binding EF-hand superfamily protein